MACGIRQVEDKMDDQSSESTIRSAENIRGKPWKTLVLLLLVLAVLFAAWLAAPPGLLGKADAIGYAVCHRIDLRSFHLGERQLPLCARCTGTFLGVIAGAAILFASGRGGAGSWPSRRIAVLLALSVVPWGLDGLNSYLSIVPRLPHLYTPQNWLRLTTGTFLGLSMAALFIPAVNQTVWRNPSSLPVLNNLREMLIYFTAAPMLIFLVLLENPVILLPLAILSTLGVLFLLTGVYMSVALLLLRKEGLLERREQIFPLILVGLLMAVLQIGAIDCVRFLLTGTWGGFQIGG
jgi:uncharacterized membrane protein